jgi:hypothetical protein
VGNLRVSLALMPVDGTAGTALSSVRLSDTLNEQLKDEPATRLRIINKDKLAAMGIPPDLAGRFLDHRCLPCRSTTSCGPQRQTGVARSSRPATRPPGSPASLTYG